MDNLLAFEIDRAFFGYKGHFLSNLSNLGKLVSITYSNSIVIAGIILIFLFIFAGYQMITGAGEPQKQQRAQQIMTWGIIGFILIVAAYFIVGYIQLALGLRIVN